MNLTLGKDQQLAVDMILEWLDNPLSERFFTLLGNAGTGKTYCLQAILEKARSTRIAFTAPTNKATKVLYKTLSQNGERKPLCRTIYSLLGCALTADGEVEVLSTPEEPVDLHDIDLIVIDEASMVNEDLYRVINEMTPEEVKILFIGDPYQLPPVKESHSKAWEIQSKFQLKEVFRNKGHILDQVLDIKDCLTTFGKNINIKNLPPDGNELTYEVYKIPPHKVQLETNRIFNELVNSGKMLEPNAFKVIAWRNETVKNWNNIIRQILWGNSPNLWVPGDRVVIASPIKSDLLEGKTVATIDDEGVLLDIVEDYHPVYKEIQIYILKIDIDEKASIKTYVLHPDSINIHSKILNEKLMEAKRDRHKWKSFWEFKKSFDDIRHGYAITAHRSQGSTYEQVLVDLKDIMMNRNRVEALKCLYVAASRPTKRLIIV